MSLTKKAMLVTLNISIIGRQMVDKRATKDANIFLNTTQEAGRYTKCKIHDDDIRTILQKADSARKKHKFITRPWDEKKIRILPAVLIMDYIKEMGICKQDFENEIIDIQNNWLGIVLKQRQRLKDGLFDINDYPDISKEYNGQYRVNPDIDLSKYFRFKHDMYPMPDKDHLVLDLEKETLDELKTQMEKDTEQKLKESRTDLIKRLYAPVANMADILGNDKRIYKTLIPNIEEQIDLLPKLNIEDDPHINQLAAEIRNKLTGYTTGQLKEDDSLKEHMRHDSEEIKAKIETFLSGSI